MSASVDDEGVVVAFSSQPGRSGATGRDGSSTWEAVLQAHPWDAVVGVGTPDTRFATSAFPPGAETVVFEPDPAARDAVARVLRRAGVSARVENLTCTATDGPATTVDRYLADHDHTCACLWIDVDGGAAPVLVGATGCLARLSRLAVVVNPARENPSSLLHLAQTWRLYLHDLRVHRLVRMPGDDPYHIQGMLDASWLDSRCAVLLPSDRDRAWRPL